MLWEYANGIDDSTVAPIPSEAKGIGNSTTLSRDALTMTDIRKCLLSLSESVGSRSHFGQNFFVGDTDIDGESESLTDAVFDLPYLMNRRKSSIEDGHITFIRRKANIMIIAVICSQIE